MLLNENIGEWLVARATGRRFGDRSGQAMTEYILTAGILLASVVRELADGWGREW
jgi:hypothetical protein